VKPFEIGARKIAAEEPTFVIAEAGVNHNGQLLLAKRLVDIAVETGADAVKFQAFRAAQLASSSATKAGYQQRTMPDGESQLEMLRRLELSEEDFREIRNHCRSRGIIFLSTAFDEESVDFLDELDVPAFKIPSGEITNSPLLEHIGAKRKPVILSTGMATLGEIDQAMRCLYDSGASQIALVQCVSEYPADVSSTNLRVMASLSQCFGVPVGLSDHSLGTEVAIAAVALGARIIEKHFTSDKSLAGPDHSASLEPGELKMLVTAIRNVETALGDGVKQPTAEELRNATVVRRSLVAAVDLEAGRALERSMVAFKRPGTGISVQSLPYLLGRKVRRKVEAGAILELEMFE
jgi:N-acetylneuraminate synthase/N,N'-diacetyllegionaminate synthase